MPSADTLGKATIATGEVVCTEMRQTATTKPSADRPRVAITCKGAGVSA